MKGTLIHLCIKNLDETKEYSYEEVKSLVEKLETKKIITKLLFPIEAGKL